MSILKQVWFLLVAIILFLPIAPIIFVVNMIRWIRKGYLLNVAVGIDQLGGCILYNEQDWTISSYTHFLCTAFGKFCRFEKFIDFWFGKGHCRKSFLDEKKEIEWEAKL